MPRRAGLQRGLARQPGPQQGHGPLDLGGPEGEGQAHEALAMDRVEVDARGRGDAGLPQRPPAELEAVPGQVADVGGGMRALIAA
jgi:hypothetical protein